MGCTRFYEVDEIWKSQRCCIHESRQGSAGNLSTLTEEMFFCGTGQCFRHGDGGTRGWHFITHEQLPSLQKQHTDIYIYRERKFNHIFF